MDRVAEVLSAMPSPMRDPVLFAIPFFVLLLVIEWTAARKLEHLDPQTPDPAPGSYATPDARASILMGLVSIATMSAWKFAALLGYAVLFAYVAPWQLSPRDWYTWVIALVGVDVLFYAYHRIAHRVRIIWATHQAHHSSRYFNFATALRQKWNNSGEIIMWAPLPLLGVPPWMVFTSFSISLVYQFWIHTERIGKLPRAIEFIFNTPSHHRVHHGTDQQYLDRNYGGILIIWDRLFGTFQPELFRPHYGLTTKGLTTKGLTTKGLTKPVTTFNIWTLETREYVAIARDVRSAAGWRDRLGYIFGPPGWEPVRSLGTASTAVGSGG